MSRRAILVLVAVCLVVAACGTRVTEETSSTATSLVRRDTAAGTGSTGGGDATGGDLGAGAVLGTTTGGTTGGTTTGGASVSGTTGGPTTGGAAVQAASGAPIVLGAVGTKSGIVGAALDYGFRALTIWEKWVNAHGGVQGRPVKVIQADDASDPGKNAAATRRLILEDHVIAFIGDIAPLTFSAGVPILEQSGVPSLGGDGAEAGWFQSPMAFPINGQNVSRSRPAAKWALAHLPQRHVALIYVSEAAAPAQLAHNFGDEFRKGGGTIVLDAGVSIATPDFTGEVVQAQNSHADIVFLLLEKAACNRYLDAARRQGYKPVIIAPACTLDNALDHKDITTNLLYSAHAAKPVLAGRSPAEDEALAAIKRFDPAVAPDGAFMFGWLAGKLFEAAMAQPGTKLTSAGIIDALHKLPATGLGGLTPLQAWPPGIHPEGRCGMVSKFDGTRYVLQTPDFVC